MQATAASALGTNRIALSATRVGLLRGLALVLTKDMLIEWRTRARLNALVIFAFGTLLIFSFALGPDTQSFQRNAGGYLWLPCLFPLFMPLRQSFPIRPLHSSLQSPS